MQARRECPASFLRQQPQLRIGPARNRECPRREIAIGHLVEGEPWIAFEEIDFGSLLHLRACNTDHLQPNARSQRPINALRRVPLHHKVVDAGAVFEQHTVRCGPVGQRRGSRGRGSMPEARAHPRVEFHQEASVARRGGDACISGCADKEAVRGHARAGGKLQESAPAGGEFFHELPCPLGTESTNPRLAFDLTDTKISEILKEIKRK